ncbi:hypothetical protein GCM10027610_063460 [Dactylosporangium cerinum]
MPVAVVISKVTFFVEVLEKVMTPAPVPEARTAPVSPLRTRQLRMRPVAPEASRMLIRVMEVAELHLMEMDPVVPFGDQYVLRLPSRTSP